jgi:hypothetical protein
MTAESATGHNAGRFLLELGALVAYGLAGWTVTAGLARIALAATLPLVVAVLWGTLRVPNDPGPAPVAVSGTARLALEGVLFGGAVVGLVVAGRPLVGGVFGALVAVHYALARERVRWLLAQ